MAMNEKEFAAWKQRQEEEILRIRREADAIRLDREAIERRLDRRIEKNARQLGGWTNNANERLEDEFAEALEDEMQIGGVQLDEVKQRIGSKYEYDLVGVNGDAVVVGEIKRKLLPEDVRHFAEERLPYFAADCPLVAGGRKIFGMVAGDTIVPDAEAEAKKRGFFVLRLKNKKLIVGNAEGARAVN